MSPGIIDLPPFDIECLHWCAPIPGAKIVTKTARKNVFQNIFRLKSLWRVGLIKYEETVGFTNQLIGL